MRSSVRQILIVALWVGWVAPAHGRWLSGPKPFSWLFQVSADFAYSQSDADFIDGASYSQQLGSAGVGQLAFGGILQGFWYVGARYEWWYAQRKILDISGGRNDAFDMHSLGLETGLRTGNPRAFWLFTGGVSYPLHVKIRTSGPSSPFLPQERNLAFTGRVMVGLRLNSVVTAIAQGGFRYLPLGPFRAATDYLPGGASLDLSGPFAGMGLGITF